MVAGLALTAIRRIISLALRTPGTLARWIVHEGMILRHVSLQVRQSYPFPVGPSPSPRATSPLNKPCPTVCCYDIQTTVVLYLIVSHALFREVETYSRVLQPIPVLGCRVSGSRVYASRARVSTVLYRIRNSHNSPDLIRYQCSRYCISHNMFERCLW